MNKTYISAQTLLDDSLELALQIASSGFKPDIIVGVWRGGCPIAIAVQEALELTGLNSDHIAIRASSYSGIAQRSTVSVDGLDYLGNNKNSLNRILLVDDVFDTGLSMDKVISELYALYGDNLPTIKLATPYFKPANNLTSRRPDYYLHETSQWLVFPHELLGLSDNEILHGKPGSNAVLRKLLALRQA